MLSEVSNFVNTARADTFLLEASRGIIPASCRAPWSFDGERIEASKVKLDQAHFRAFAGWEFRDERLMQLELIDAIESEGVDPTPPAMDDGCNSCCVTQ